MIIVDGEAVGSGVPPKGGIPPRQERKKKMVVSPAVARSLKQAAEAPEPEGVELTDTEKEADEQAAAVHGAYGGFVDISRQDVDFTQEAPKDYAPKGDWVDYAVSKGADRDEAEASTKAELIDTYGKES